MTEQTGEATATETTATETQTATVQTEQKPTETVEFWKTKAREQEKRAKDNADAAKRLQEIEDAQKTETQKTADRIAALETEAAEARRDALRFKVAAKFGVSDEDTELFLTGSDEETVTKQAERLAERTAERKKNGNHAPREGSTPTAGEDAERAFARQLFSPPQE